MIYIGIDPGQTGAVAIIKDSGDCKPDIKLFDTPTVIITKSGKAGKKKNKTEYLPASMAEILLPYSEISCHLFLEKVHSMPGQGVSSTFNFGEGYGIWIGIIAALKIPHTYVAPQTWKRVIMSGLADKDAYRIRAQELFPSQCEQLRYKKDIGKADALLIAEYGRRLDYKLNIKSKRTEI